MKHLTTFFALMCALTLVLGGCDKKTDAKAKTDTKTTKKAPETKKPAETKVAEKPKEAPKVETQQLTPEDETALKGEYADEVSTTITADNADKMAAELEKEILGDK